MAARGHHAEFDMFEKSDDERRNILQKIESMRHQRNVVSDRIAKMRKAGDDTEALVVEMRAVSSEIKKLDKKLSNNQKNIDAFLLGLPNIAHSSVPFGADEKDNPVVGKAGHLRNSRSVLNPIGKSAVVSKYLIWIGLQRLQVHASRYILVLAPDWSGPS